MSKLWKLVLVEDHEFTRTGLRYSFLQYQSLQIVGEASNGIEGSALVEEKQPDIVLMDIGMPKMDGITASREIKKAYPHIKVIMLTSRQFTEEIYAALSSGADAYCMKDISTERLLQVLETVMAGAVWLDPNIAHIVVSALPVPNSVNEVSKIENNALELTGREYDVLKLIAQGKANKDIADSLGLSIHTIKSHVRSLIQKLAVSDRTQMALKAVQEGLI
jgi:two-component system, NarL family, response regulator LiaR